MAVTSDFIPVIYQIGEERGLDRDVVVEIAKNAIITAYKKDNPDLVILDMKIPGMDGIEILKHVKEINEDIKVILMTAYGELDMIQEAKDLGALMHFAKPFDIDEIRQAVRDQLAVEA